MTSKITEPAGAKVLVTGSSLGIGFAIAELLAQSGALVVMNGRNADRLQSAVDSVGNGSTGIACDVGDPDAAEELVRHAHERLGGLDLVVNSAGVIQPQLLPDISVDEFKTHLDVNVTGTFVVAKTAAEYMVKNGFGCMINIGSELSHFGIPYYISYCASKHAVIGLTRAMAAELAPSVRVNAVCPGPVMTPMQEAEIEWFGGTDEIWKEANERAPMKRMAEPQEIARAVRFLAFDAPYATGTAYQIDGGTTAV